MYPLRYKIASGVILSATFLVLLVFTFQSLSYLRGDPVFIHQAIPQLFILSSIALVVSPILLGRSGCWVLFSLCGLAIYIISALNSYPVYNLQSVILLGVAINVHIFYREKGDIISERYSLAVKIKEATNILKTQRLKMEKVNEELSKRVVRYRSLKEIGESFTAKLSLEQIYKLAAETAYNAIPHSDIATLFIVDEIKQKLELTASKSAAKPPSIKSKNGDIFDQWVFKERQPLSVLDINEDFRFDYKPLPNERPFASLISVPLVSQNRIAGILRLNSGQKNAYSFDDLRLLDFISDLVSTAVNNARLYKITEELSIKDSLTGLYIYRYLKQRLEEEVRRAHLTNAPLSVIMIDIDHFKDYNDKYGHSAGDKVLLGVSEIMRHNLKDGYVIARYGGEEFVILLPWTLTENAKELAEKIRKEIASRPFLLRRQDTHVTVSAGVSSYSDEIKDAEELLKRADFCLYKAKREGRNKVCVA